MSGAQHPAAPASTPGRPTVTPFGTPLLSLAERIDVLADHYYYVEQRGRSLEEARAMARKELDT